MNALEFATFAHVGQKRKDGKDYITHPIAVAELAKGLAEYYFDRCINDKDTMEAHWFWDCYSSKEHFIKCAEDAALLHDVVEDTEITIEDIEKNFDFQVMTAVKLVSKLEGEEYFDFIFRLITSKHKLAMIVKIADLTHNLSDLNKGSLKDKYRFAKQFIYNKLFNV